MSEWLRRLRGMLGVGATWGVAWAGIGAAVGLVLGLVNPFPFALSDMVTWWAVGMGLYGLTSGMGFAAVLSLTEGRHTLDELSLKRVALWGVVGSAAVPLLFAALGAFGAGTSAVDVVEAMLLTSALGGMFAPASVAAARRAQLPSGDAPAALPPADES